MLYKNYCLPLLLSCTVVAFTSVMSVAFNVCGITEEEIPYWDAELCSILESVQLEKMDSDEMNKMAEEIFTFLDPRPKADVPVWISGNGTYQKTVSDENGHFCFSDLPAGDYLLSIPEMDSAGEAPAPITKTIYVRRDIQNARVIRAVNRVSIQGRIVDSRGQPIQDATIRGTFIPSSAGQPSLTARSTTNGCFEFSGILPAAFHRSAPAYLMGRDPLSLDEIPTAVYLELHAEKDGFREDTTSGSTVPLIPESMLPLATFWKHLMIRDAELRDNAISRVLRASQYRAARKYTPKDLPKSKGNIILVDDIILKRVEKPDAVETP